jgi:hypothetical protein
MKSKAIAKPGFSGSGRESYNRKPSNHESNEGREPDPKANRGQNFSGPCCHRFLHHLWVGQLVPDEDMASSCLVLAFCVNARGAAKVKTPSGVPTSLR